MPQKVLLIEDEADQREVLNSILESQGYTTLATDRAEVALTHLSSFLPNLIVTDVKLPGIDGITFFEEVRKKNGFHDMPFIFITAYNDPTAISRLTKMESVDYVTKPYDIEKLLNLVQQTLPDRQ
jgi:CheY-like chemotaxis protein